MITATTTGGLNSPRRASRRTRAQPVPVAQPDPAVARRQALETDARPAMSSPVVEMPVVRHLLLDLGIGPDKCPRVARQRGPAELADRRQNSGADRGGTKPGSNASTMLSSSPSAGYCSIVHVGTLVRWKEHRAHVHAIDALRRLVNRLRSRSRCSCNRARGSSGAGIALIGSCAEVLLVTASGSRRGAAVREIRRRRP